MKRQAEYWLNHNQKWTTASGVMMGIALFVHALYYFALTPLASLTTVQLVLQLSLPLAMQVVWIVLLQGIRIKRAIWFGYLGMGICLVLICHGFLSGGILAILLTTFLYLIAGAVLFFVVGGFFPHRRIGFVVLAAVVCLRVVFLGMLAHLFRGQWMCLLQEIPAVCMSAAVWCLLGGIRATRVKQK